MTVHLAAETSTEEKTWVKFQVDPQSIVGFWIPEDDDELGECVNVMITGVFYTFRLDDDAKKLLRQKHNEWTVNG